MDYYSPIVLFVYNRPELTLKTIQSLKQNTLAQYSDLFIYSDHYKKDEDKHKVEQVRKIIRNIEGFKSLTVYEANYNKGLAASIIEGVSYLVEEYGSIIVLEDDLVTSPNFLEYMNKALEFYSHQKNIWSISGYTPIEISDIVTDKEVYFTGRASSWGWATWKDRWVLNNWEIEKYENIFNSKLEQKEFNRYGNDLFPMLQDQKNRHIDSWAIRWCFNQFINKSYTVYPIESLVSNVGLIGDSTHGSFKSKQVEVTNRKNFKLSNIYMNVQVEERFKKHYNLNLYNYIGFILKKLGMYKPVKTSIKKFRTLLTNKKKRTTNQM